MRGEKSPLLAKTTLSHQHSAEGDNCRGKASAFPNQSSQQIRQAPNERVSFFRLDSAPVALPSLVASPMQPRVL